MATLYFACVKCCLLKSCHTYMFCLFLFLVMYRQCSYKKPSDEN